MNLPQNLADILAATVHRPVVTNHLGARRRLRGGIAGRRVLLARPHHRALAARPRVQPPRDAAWREGKYAGWQDAVQTHPNAEATIWNCT